MTHSIMFHHFHDDFHLPAQGGLSALNFDLMIKWLSDRYNILDIHFSIKRRVYLRKESNPHNEPLLNVLQFVILIIHLLQHMVYFIERKQWS